MGGSNNESSLGEKVTLRIRNRHPASMRKGDIQGEGVDTDLQASPRLDLDICEVGHEVSGQHSTAPVRDGVKGKTSEGHGRAHALNLINKSGFRVVNPLLGSSGKVSNHSGNANPDSLR